MQAHDSRAVFFRVVKGQLISKGRISVLILPKKEVENVSGELKKLKSPFENNWPLAYLGIRIIEFIFLKCRIHLFRFIFWLNFLFSCNITKGWVHLYVFINDIILSTQRSAKNDSSFLNILRLRAWTVPAD